MKFSTLAIGTATMVAGALVLAPTASAATPTTASVQVDCGAWGTGPATLRAGHNGSAATVTFATPVVWASHSIPANSLQTTATLTNASGEEVTFSGQSNPDVGAARPALLLRPPDGYGHPG
ncbi:hypothetical protein [Streptomyces althioticus]|uniref:hypothetical protein n=1 Tax=Streptomyces althioticus TaxID=83380 RepID=UPI003804B2EC